MSRLTLSKVKVVPKIVVTNAMGLTPAQKVCLERLGEVKFYDDMPATANEWLERCKGHDIVCSWMAGLREKYSVLQNVFISVPFVGVSSFADPGVCRKNNITISNSPGCNRNAVCEWIIYMILTTMRRFDRYINTSEKLSAPPSHLGLAGKKLTVLGMGHIGLRVGGACEALEMSVTYFRRGDKLLPSVKNADVVVDTLSYNPSSHGILGREFFQALKPGAIFISPTVKNIVDFEAMLAALDGDRLAFVGHDVMDAKPGDTSDPLYEKLRQHPKVFATPHIAGFSDVTTKTGNEMMIANIEAYLAGKPINVFGK